MSNRPMPKVNPVNQAFWAACNEGVLKVQRCDNEGCRKYVFYPRVCCPYCGCNSLTWSEVSGQGKVITFTEVYRPQHESFRSEVPIWFVAVQLVEGPLLYSRLVNPPPQTANIVGCPVRLEFSSAIEGQRLPYFRLLDR
jgi:uncharacterized OB-fold protein